MSGIKKKTVSQSQCENLIKRYNALVARRQQMEAYWNSLIYFFLPEHGTKSYRYAEHNVELPVCLNSAPALACQEFAKGLYSHTFSATDQELAITTKDATLKDNGEVKDYYSELSSRVYEELKASNYAVSYFEALTVAAALNQAVVYYEGVPGQGLHFKKYSLYECALDYNSRDKLDTCFRSCKLSAKQAVEKFGENNVHKNVLEASNDAAKAFDMVEFFHAVQPNPKFKGDAAGKVPKGLMRFSSYWVDSHNKHVCSEGGYNYFPYVAPRLMSLREGMATGPSAYVLPDARQLNYLTYQFTYSIDMACKPPLATTYAELVKPGALRPGTINHYYRDPQDPTKEPWSVYPATPDPAAVYPALDTWTQKVRDGFNLGVFSVYQQTETMTATEAALRNQSSVEQIVPTVARIVNEFHVPIIEGCVVILQEMGRLPVPPEGLVNTEFNAEFSTLLSRRIAETKNEALQRSLVGVGTLYATLANAPALGMIVKTDDAAREVLRNANVDPVLIYDETETKKKQKDAEDQMEKYRQEELEIERARVSARPVDPNKKPEAGSLAARMTQ